MLPDHQSQINYTLTITKLGHNILANQTNFINELLNKSIIEGLSYSDVANLNLNQPIYQWWLITDWLAHKLFELKEPLLTTNFGIWWGRTSEHDLANDLALKVIIKALSEHDE